MVEFDGDSPFFYWTFDSFGDLEREREEFGKEVWKRNDIPLGFAIGTTSIAFDPPDEWGQSTTIRMEMNVDGYYEHNSPEVSYVAVRAHTKTHEVLTGRWKQDKFGSGVFIAVFPKKA